MPQDMDVFKDNDPSITPPFQRHRLHRGATLPVVTHLLLSSVLLSLGERPDAQEHLQLLRALVSTPLPLHHNLALQSKTQKGSR